MSCSLVRCSTIKQSEEFESERFICFRGIKYPDYVGEDEENIVWCIFLLPVNCLYNHNQITKTNTNHVFNHSLHHPIPFHFKLPHVIVPTKFSELFHASWVVLGTTIYFFGATGSEIFYLKRKFGGSTTPFSVRFRSAGHMTCERRAPKLVSLGEKIYVFGHGKGRGSFCEVFELYPGRLKGQSRPISSPFPPSGDCDILFAVGMENEKKIVVGWNFKIKDEKVVNLLFPEELTSGTAIFMFDAEDGSWVKHKNNLFVNPKRLTCQPIIVGNCLFWLSTKLWAYDLESRQYYEGHIEDCFFQYALDKAEVDNHSVSLFHLDEDFFRLMWGSYIYDEVIHCMVIQVIRTTCNLQANRYKLRASVVSCQTFTPSLNTFIGDGALIL